MISLLDTIETSSILTAYKQLEDGIKWIEYPNGKQTGLQYNAGNDPWEDAVGRMKAGQKWTTDALVNPYFKDTIFEELIKKYKMTRTRLMWLKPYSCYSMHRDDTPRIHIPLVTNDHCFFVFRDKGCFNLSVGGVHLVDTTQYHSAMNCSTEWRLHILGSQS
jgi:hypothetical protein